MSITTPQTLIDYKRSRAPLTGACEVRVTFGAVFPVTGEELNAATKLELLKALREELEAEIGERE